MGAGSSKPTAESREASRRATRGVVSEFVDMCFVIRSMEAGGCADEFRAATRGCHPAAVGEDPDDVGACVRATAALRKCMKGNKAVFKGYIRILDEEVEQRRRAARGEAEPPPAAGRDEDEFPRRFKWWTGMRRS